MKLKLRLNIDTEKEIKKELEQKEIEISDDAKLTLTEDDYHEGMIECKDKNGKVLIAVEDICFIESIGKEVWVNTLDNKYRTSIR